MLSAVLFALKVPTRAQYTLNIHSFFSIPDFQVLAQLPPLPPQNMFKCVKKKSQFPDMRIVLDCLSVAEKKYHDQKDRIYFGFQFRITIYCQRKSR